MTQLDADRRLPVYDVVVAAIYPLIRWWGRLEVVGIETAPHRGPLLIMGNHDSGWDPFVVAVALAGRRQVHALAIADLWRRRSFAWFLNHIGQIPLDRDRADVDAISEAIRQLDAGACIGIFPEGTVSRGRTLRARSGAGRLALAVPAAQVLCVAVTGAGDIARFPTRPRLRVEFFAPDPSGPIDGETARELSTRITAQIRAVVPVPSSADRSRSTSYAAVEVIVSAISSRRRSRASLTK